MVSSWIRELYLQNQRYNSLISSGFNASDLQLLQLPVKLPLSTAADIYSKLSRLQTLLLMKPDVTNHDMMAALYPNQSQYYAHLRKEAKSSSVVDVIEPVMMQLRIKEVNKETISSKNKGAQIATIDQIG